MSSRYKANPLTQHGRLIEQLRASNAKLRDQDKVHWKTRRTLLRQINEARRASQDVVDVIYRVETRCMASDGPVTPTLQEMREDELREIYLAVEQIKAALSREGSDP